MLSLELLEIPDRVKSAKIKQLEKSNIHSIEDLVKFQPKKIIDCTNAYKSFKQFYNIQEPIDGAIIGVIERVVAKNSTVYAIVRGEDNVRIYVYWYNQSYIRNELVEHEKCMFCGEITYFEKFGQIQMVSPYDFSYNLNSLSGYYPIYKIDGMSKPYVKNLMEQALDLFPKEDWLEPSVKQELGLMDEYEAVRILNLPQTKEEYAKRNNALNRLLFDDLFYFNFKVKMMEKDNRIQSDYPITSCQSWHKLMPKLPFDLTKDQKETLTNMYKIMKSNYRLNALVQGDVGSGKTMIAIFLAFIGMEHNYQSVIIAPTEVLAAQHYAEFTQYLDDEDKDKCCLLIGSVTKKQKEKIKERIKNGEIKIVIGTHAVIQPDIEYNDLGFVIIDEQHRFGVEQRENLLKRDKLPHYINLSATPIPRTLSQVIYGDKIQVFNILSKPNGRKPIITKMATSDDETNRLILEQINQGHQAYIVCPLIKKSKSEKFADIDSVEVVYEKTKKAFASYPNIKVGVINGDMKKKEIDEYIQKFLNKELDILISTTIIEVGVNIPNATIIVIKNSERFGLAQLHQLRGRVGRNSLQSYCLLQTPNNNDKKAKVMCSTTNGFEIARKDFEIRGPGDFIGKKQSGQNKYLLLMMDHELLYSQINNINNKIFNDPVRYNHYKFLEEMELYEVLEEENVFATNFLKNSKKNKNIAP